MDLTKLPSVASHICNRSAALLPELQPGGTLVIKPYGTRDRMAITSDGYVSEELTPALPRTIYD